MSTSTTGERKTWIQRELEKPDVPGFIPAFSRCGKCLNMVKEGTEHVCPVAKWK